MKKYLYLFAFIFSGLIHSQSSGITYQAVIYNPGGEELPGQNNINAPLTEQDICLRFNFIDSSGGLEYQEVIQVTTDIFGMVNVIIGNDIQTGGYADGFEGIVWDGSAKNLMVEVDIKGNCSDYDEISNQPFTYIPFAYYSANPGNPGPAGPAGEQGEQGPAGPQGEQGDVGQTGPAGADGVAGPPGEQGDVGQTGPAGDDGVAGPQGEQGPAGADGIGGVGSIGPVGPQGEQGDVGQTGPQGNQGITGENGLTAYEVWINLGNTGTEQEFIDSLVGPQGETGLLAEGTEEGNTTYWNGTEWVLNSNNLYNDGTNVMIGTTDVEESAALNVSSDNQGILIPRLTLEQRDAITSPVAGLLVFQTNETPGFYYYDGSIWVSLTSTNTNTNGTGSGSSSSTSLIYTVDGW
ncbi:collagen-like protein [bacterium]|nr:collagen-like protein [bacterium]